MAAVFGRLIVNKVNLCRLSATGSFSSHSRILSRYFSSTPRFSLKKVVENTEGDVTTIEGKYIKSAREEFMVKSPEEKEIQPAEESAASHQKPCPLCALDLEVKYTDVLIISQFLRPDGCPLPRRVTGLCNKQQRRLMKLTRQAQQAGLMPELRPDLPGGKQRQHIKSQYKFKKYNVYFMTREEKKMFRQKQWENSVNIRMNI
ncbi:large ribosomal subunit protein mL66-like [Tubulanus polymorphus]|uniref:large ribosomal subunit protein mL66-like n=1 Tax=Tubulanus polymorphus TaxID=672921 RepID=UPI003DA53E64